MRIRRAVSAFAIGIASVIGVLGATSQAVAAPKDGVHQVGEFGLYQGLNLATPVLDVVSSEPNLATVQYPGTTITVDNNSRSAWNRSPVYWRVFTQPNYTGFYGDVQPGEFGNLYPVFQNSVSSLLRLG